MGIYLSIFAIFVLVAATLIIYGKIKDSEFIAAGYIVGGFSILTMLPFLCVGLNFIYKDVSQVKLENRKYILTRMLEEDYNPANLREAILFNNDMKKVKFENSTFTFKYRTDVVYVDTITIPDSKFIPTSRLLLSKDSTWIGK